ncbi:hypothetical protein F750_4684 [Streptomyces sp. PAMC 26508]|nr:hypothetical protein F750_4684 [Streptomyces sp. PAMC 26508]
MRRGPKANAGVVPCRGWSSGRYGPGGAGPLPSLERSCR